MYSHQHTIVDNVAPEPDNLIFFPEYLQSAGYQTGFFGKWHMGNDNPKPRKGFNRWISFKGQGVYYNPTLNIDGVDKVYADSSYTPTLITDFALDWMKTRDKSKPFFAYISHKSVHEPFGANKKDLDIYKNETITWPESMALTDEKTKAQYKDVPKWVQRQRNSWHGVEYAYHGMFDMNQIIRKYCEAMHSVDEEIGRVMKYLKDNDLDKNTVVIYMGDNGFMFGEHGLIDKRVAYEESWRVPMLVRCPDLIQAGSSITQLIQNTDIAPTVLNLAGIKTPQYMVGNSMVPLLKGEKEVSWRDKIFYEYFWEYDFPHTPTQFAVRNDRYKYIRYQGIWDTNELYDLQNDPHEMHNLIREPQHQDMIKTMAGQIYDWLETTKGMQIPLKRTIKYRAGDHENKKVF